MALSRLSIHITGVDRALKLFQDLRLTKPQTRNLLYDLGVEMRWAGWAISPQDSLRGVDPRRRPADKSFRNMWRSEVKQEVANSTIEAMELRVGNVDPRAEWIIEGTGPRAIPSSVTSQLAKGYPMSFFWLGGPYGAGWYESWQITGGVAAHGTPPHPVVEGIVREVNIPAAIQRLADLVVSTA